MTACTLWTDGGARGNPGPAGIGIVLEGPDGVVACEAGRFIGVATNNVAEYQALILGLENAANMGFDHIVVKADSELVVRQMRGEYRVKNANLAPLYRQAKALSSRFSSFRIEHIRRAENARADNLANAAMDARADVGDTCASAGAATQGTLFDEE